MPLYLVESTLPGITMDELSEVQRGMAEASSELTRSGKFVRYLRITFLPGDSRCLCLFEATDADFARQANDRAQIPYTGISNAFELVP